MRLVENGRKNRNKSSNFNRGSSALALLRAGVSAFAILTAAYSAQAAEQLDAPLDSPIVAPAEPPPALALSDAQPPEASAPVQAADVAAPPVAPVVADAPAAASAPAMAEPAASAEAGIPVVVELPPEAPLSLDAPVSVAAEPSVVAPSAAESQAPVAVAAQPAAPSPFALALKQASAASVDVAAPRAAPGQTAAPAIRREREAVAATYAQRNFEPLWISGGQWNDAARAVLVRLSRAREDGLDLAQYPLPSLAADDAGLAAAELALSQAVVGYARQASGGRIEPRSLSALITSKPEVVDSAAILMAVASAPDAGEALNATNPPHPGYRALRAKLEEVRREKPALARKSLTPGPDLKVGMKDPRVPLVRATFGIDARADGSVDELIYDTRVASAVADFQRANGLPANGTLTARTISALSNGQPAQLEAEILANMERWRWLPRDMGETRIEVNIPDYEAKLSRGDKVVHRTKVIVGKPNTPTPIFSDEMEYVVVNPYWNVPTSIIKKEMLPAYQRDPSYFSRRGYEVIERKGQIIVRQPPGERNALGLIKFIFPNEHSVYLHDTPSRGMFSSARRAFSHGCVRVFEPFALAEALLPAEYSQQRLRKMVGGGEKTVRLPQHIPVHLQYFTAYVDADGKLQVRDDIYGYSRRVRAALGV